MNNEEICLCSYCRNMLYTGDHIGELKVFDPIDNELESILLAHVSCIEESNHSGWEYD